VSACIYNIPCRSIDFHLAPSRQPPVGDLIFVSAPLTPSWRLLLRLLFLRSRNTAASGHGPGLLNNENYGLECHEVGRIYFIVHDPVGKKQFWSRCGK